MQKFRGKGPQNAGNCISGCLDLKILRGTGKKKARSAAGFMLYHNVTKYFNEYPARSSLMQTI